MQLLMLAYMKHGLAVMLEMTRIRYGLVRPFKPQLLIKNDASTNTVCSMIFIRVVMHQLFQMT